MITLKLITIVLIIVFFGIILAIAMLATLLFILAKLTGIWDLLNMLGTMQGEMWDDLGDK